MRFFEQIYNKILFLYYHVSVGKQFSCKGRIIIQGHGTYVFGDDLLINSRLTANPIGGARTVFQTLNNHASIIIGNHVGMSHAILSAREKIMIEDNVLLGAGCKLYDNDFHSLSYHDRIKGKDDTVQSGSIYIKEGAFIGAHAIILKGVTIGRHSVVGAGAVVTKNVPDYEIWAGNPAKKVGSVKD